MADKKPPLNRDTKSALMGDLESIRTLLESEDADDDRPDEDDRPDDDEPNIPVLEDVVATGKPSDTGRSAVSKDRWRLASDAFAAQARALIRAKGLGDHLSGAQQAVIDALIDTLKAALDEELDQVREELHARLEDELDHIKSELFDDSD